MSIMLDTKVRFLSDKLIEAIALDTLYDYRDINLNYKKYYHPYKGGIYDPTIFGSLYTNRCNCGRERSAGIKCNYCRSKVLSDSEKYSRYARIESPIYYISEIKVENFIKFLKGLFQINVEITDSDGVTLPLIRALELGEMKYDKETSTLTISEPNNIKYCSFEGLKLIFETEFPEKLDNLISYLNKNILVVPIIMRPIDIMYSGNEQKLAIHPTSKTYQNLIFILNKFYSNMSKDLGSSIHLAYFNAAIRCYVRKVTSDLSNLLRSSKSNYARTMQSTRLTNSGRCTIVPAPDITIDEVKLPRHLFYEASIEEFIEFLQVELSISRERAEHLAEAEASNIDIQKLFTLFAEGSQSDPETYPGKYVIINRAPTLHEYNLLCCKVRLTNENTMGLPIALCNAFNADFDGDTMSWFSVPRDVQDLVRKKMAPSTMNYYKKNHMPLFLPTQEVIQGLIIASKALPLEPKFFAETIEELRDLRKDKTSGLKYQTPIEFGGEVTTLGRLELSRFFNVDINDITLGINTPLSIKDITSLYRNIINLPDRIVRMKDAQEFALKIVTIYGVTSLTLEELCQDFDDEIFNEIKQLQSSNLSAREIDLKTRELYSTYLSKVEASIPKETLTKVQESARMKTSQLISIICPRLTSSLKGDVTLGTSSIIEGMNFEDYKNLSIENRGTQAIKQDNVPGGGYFTRQMVYVASSFSFSEGSQSENKGILLEENRAEGRTLVDGTIVGKSSSSDFVRVRSLVTSTTSEPIITPDLISNLIEYEEGSSIGISLITSLSEGLTQGMLALKHGGNLFSIQPYSDLIAIEEISKISETDNFVIGESTSGKVYTYVKPESFVKTPINQGSSIKKGSSLGVGYTLVAPSYTLDSFISLTKTRKVTPSKSFERNTIKKSSCFTIKEGVIHYDLEKGIVSIGGIDYPYNKENTYNYPEGYEIKELTRFCSGILDIDWYISQNLDYEQVFYLFRAQIREMTSSLVDELIEFLFILIVKKQGNKILNLGVNNSIHNNAPFITELAFENYKKAFKKVTSEGLDISNDVFGSSFLPTLLNLNF